MLEIVEDRTTSPPVQPSPPSTRLLAHCTPPLAGDPIAMSPAIPLGGEENEMRSMREKKWESEMFSFIKQTLDNQFNPNHTSHVTSNTLPPSHPSPLPPKPGLTPNWIWDLPDLGLSQNLLWLLFMEMVNWVMEIYSPASYFPKSDWILLANTDGKWTMEENKIFEKALAIHDKETPDRWQKIVEMIPGKSLEEVRRHYNVLVDDVSHIEAGLVPIPGYTSSSFTLEWVNTNGFDGFKQAYGVSGRRGGGGGGGRPSDHERKKSIPWTEEEHKRFLMGLKKYGKGDWRNISRNFVISRTPTQVASHAQKYFIRLSSVGKDKRRSSIHDITTVNLPDERTPSPSKTQALLSNHPNSAETTDPNQSKGAPAFSNQWHQMPTTLMQNHYGNNPYGIKFEPQNSHQSNIFESEVGHQDMFFQMQPSRCYPHG